jgi:S1-C subfamily serine protease
MKLSSRGAGFFALAVAACLVACSTSVQKVSVGTVPTAPLDARTKIIQFRKVADVLPKGEPIGKSRFGVLCLPGKPLAWRDGRSNVNDDEFAESFRIEVEKSKFAVVAEAGPLVDSPTNPKAEFVVSGQIAKASIDACSPWSDFGNWRDAKGGAYVKVQWQVYSVAQRKAVLEAVTEGSFQTDDSVEGGVAELMRNAFAAATQNLLANTSFYRAVHGDPKPKTQGVAAMGVEPLRAVEQIKDENGAGEPKSAVLTVIAGMNRGSGFVVTTDGYLIASERTVRGYNLVKLKSASGRESLGFVVRRDEVSDLALIKLTERSTASLAVRPAPAVLAGEEVYVLDATAALRTPENTIRRGIVGAQKDAVSPKLVRTTVLLAPLDAGAPFFDKNGKVVGVAVWPATEGGAQPSAGGFIPIGEAMERLALGLK